ncbi:hypothetical protein J7L48_07700, partial [bacterium]|nr:hypothetical protein [bacterium]
RNKERRDTIKYNTYRNHNKIKNINFKEFYDTDLFNKIEQYINKPQRDYRVLTIGLHPAILQHNGFFTLGGYQSVYPLSYKHEFRKIIENELNKNEHWKGYFDNWGNRCYAFVGEFKKIEYTKYENKKIKHLELNTRQLKKMKCEYVISSVEIENYKDNDLSFMRSFEGKVWRIFLYSVRDTSQQTKQRIKSFH